MKVSVAVPITIVLVIQAWYRKSLTPEGIVAALVTAEAHVGHPWLVFYAYLVVFFITGTAVTKVSHLNTPSRESSTEILFNLTGHLRSDMMSRNA